MTQSHVSGIEPGQRRLNAPQTTGRDYRNLSQPAFTTTRDDDVRVPMRDVLELLADAGTHTASKRCDAVGSVRR